MIERFPFDDLEPIEYDAIMYSRWPDKLIHKEPSLFHSKWFDVRHMHVVQATYFFGYLFTKLTREMIRRHIDPSPPVTLQSGRVRDWEPLKTGDIFDPPANADRLKQWKIKIKALIELRQIADSCGIPYNFFIFHGLKHWYFGRNYFLENRKLPSPSMLKNPDCLAAIAENWMVELKARVHYSDNPRYLVKYDYGQLDARAHQVFICDQIKCKSDPNPAIAKFFNLELIGEKIISEYFGEERLLKCKSKNS